MNRFTRLVVCATLSIGFALVAAGTAGAGSFTMKQCAGSGQLDFQATFAAVNGSQSFDAVSGCSPSGSGKIGIYQDRSGDNLTFGAGGQFRWDAPTGIAVTGTRFTARLKDANGIEAELSGYNGVGNTDLDGGVVHDGVERTSSWSSSANPQTLILVRLSCQALSGCENQPGSVKAFTEATDAEFTVQDTAAPAIGASGDLWTWAGDSAYHRGTASATVGGVDQGSGIAGAWAEINGLRVDFNAPVCPGDKGAYSTRFTPCPLTYFATRSFDTSAAPFQEGSNQIRLCVRDYAGSEAAASKICNGARTLLVDNERPAPPVDLRTDEGTAWQPENGFTLRWEIPSGQVSPIVGATYLLREAGTGTVVASKYVPGTGIESIGPVDVPDVGEYEASVTLFDGGSNIGEAAETTLRFDDRPPGNVSPAPASGWISRDELPISQEIEKAQAGGPSGISGYALSVSESGPTQPCDTVVCLAPEITLNGGADERTGSIGGLAEGDHWISAAAVSGAKRSSLEPGTTVVQVDRTAPATSIFGVPTEWVNHPVTVTVQATDSLSGMQPSSGDDGDPATVIDADNYATYESPGPFATFSVATEGVNRVRYWAEDLAGNRNDGKAGTGGDIHPSPGQAIVRIDTSPPEVAFKQERDPEDPELVELFADDPDSGVSSASIGIRSAGSGSEFTSLPTSEEDGRFLARVPSDDLPPGAYELNARVTDRAGNEATGNGSTSGQPMILTLPLKQPTEIAATIGKGRKSLTVKYGPAQFIDGRLTSGGSALINQPVRIVETFRAGSKQSSVTRELRSDGDGRFRLGLTPGPSREITVQFDGTRKLSRSRSADLSLNVKGKVGFRIKPRKVFNGGVIRMTGRVGFRGALPPARGKLVAIQYLDPSRGKWRPVEVLRTNRRGKFRFTYRFRTISSAQKIRFRASVLQEAGWPYLPSTSKPRSVIVYPKE